MLLLVSQSVAEEKIIKQEAMTFEKCLEVITTSENKLSIVPELTEVSDQRRVAVFKLLDGKLIITCSKVTGEVIVSTSVN